MRLPRLGIRARIYCGFGSLLVLGGALASIALWALFSIDREVAQMSTTSDRIAVLREVSGNIETMRTSVHRSNFSAQDNGRHGCGP